MARAARREDGEAPRPTAELPPEVLERLSLHGKVRLFVGDDLATGVEAVVAPLHRQLFLFVTRGGETERRLLEEPCAVIQAEDRPNEWVLRATGRAVPGRVVLAEPRRTELVHWLPEGVAPAGLVAVRFHPETVDYTAGRGEARTRAQGPVPHGALPGVFTRWATLATEDVVLWFFAMGILDWLGLMLLFDHHERPALLVVLVIVVGVLLLAGVQLVHRAAAFRRWREGVGGEREAALLLAGWEASARIERAGFGMMVLGLLLAGLLAVGAGWKVGALGVVASAAPLLALFHVARHLLRRQDAETEKG